MVPQASRTKREYENRTKRTTSPKSQFCTDFIVSPAGCRPNSQSDYFLPFFAMGYADSFPLIPHQDDARVGQLESSNVQPVGMKADE